MDEKTNHNHVISVDKRYLYDLVSRVIEENLNSDVEIHLSADVMQNWRSFNQLYDTKYTHLKKKTDSLLLDMGAATLDFTWQQSGRKKEREEMEHAFHHLKYEVLSPVYGLLGPEVKEASRTALDLVDLIFRKRVKSDDIHKIVAGLARWHVLDDLQRQLQPRDLAGCFAAFDAPLHAGHPVENLYELADKECLRETLEALYREKYSMTVADGWLVSQARTKQFLMAFMLSLYRNPLAKLYGKMAAFHRFFTDVCGYAFIKVARTLQIWLYGYQDFDRKRANRFSNKPKDEPQQVRDSWLRKVRKYTGIEQMAEWMRSRFPLYGIRVA